MAVFRGHGYPARCCSVDAPLRVILEQPPRAMKREAAVVAMVVVALVETRRAGPANPRLGSEGGLTEGDPLATQSCPISCR